jgi:hypothetical protein
MNKLPRDMDPDQYAALSVEATKPFRNLRLFFYGGFGVYGLIGAFVFFFKVLAGRDLATTVPNLLLQLGLVAAMGGLFRWEGQRKQQDIETMKREMRSPPKPATATAKSAANRNQPKT